MSFPEKLDLPPAPDDLTGSVKCWSQPVVMKTYLPDEPGKNPMFLESRVYQGSSGRVYPLPFIERIARAPVSREWKAVHLENEYLRLMILPELGGRIHVGFDKTNDYDFFYRQNVIKPALVGLAGPWISGGVEFNWPQHHRPATYMPVEVVKEEHSDGSVTVWCSDHDPFDRLKGMHGVCLHSHKAYIELKVRLYNRTELTYTFLWWANMAAEVHERYQSFFPPDVHYVADHAKRATSTFPLCEGVYYGVNYGARAASSVPADQVPSQFTPPGDYPPNDLSWYANIPVPTSYMALGSEGDFFGGYDHRRQAGVVHIANHHIAPGKKQWTWGNGEFGYAWDRNLTEDDGPYIELMAGVYTDNQPDFSFLAPGETKTFNQYWYPIQKMGVPTKANQHAALRVELSHERNVAQLVVCVSEEYPGAFVTFGSKERLGEWTANLVPGQLFSAHAGLPLNVAADHIYVELRDSRGGEILCYQASESRQKHANSPEPATEPPHPSQVANNEELYLIAQHLVQYRHATRSPVPYWQEAIRRDPEDSRSNNALGEWHLRRGEFSFAEQCLRTAIGRITSRNPNPANGEAFYHLGLSLRYQSREKEAYDAFYKAVWNYSTRSCAYHALAELDTASNRLTVALEHITLALRTNADQSNAQNLGVVVLRKLGREAEAREFLEQNLAVDPADQWARYLACGARPVNNQMALDLAFDYARAGLYAEARILLEQADRKARDGSAPVLCYTLAWLSAKCEDTLAAERWLAQAGTSSPDFCFPNRLEEMLILQWAGERNRFDAKAHYYLGNFLYDRRRYQEAIEHWEQSVRIEPDFPTAWRNLGIAYFNAGKDPERARDAFNRAFHRDQTDGRVLYERDQLWKRVGVLPSQRLLELEAHLDLVDTRDDLSIELIALYNQEGQHEKAFSVLTSRTFQPWEGGEGLAIGQYARTQIALGRCALESRNDAAAKALFQAALASPKNLGEAKHPLANQANIYYWLGVANERLGDATEALACWRRAASTHGDFQEMSVKAFSEASYYQALALRKLGQSAECERMLRSLLAYAEDLANTTPAVDYFATSLPAMLLFNEDLERRNKLQSMVLEAQAKAGLGELAESVALLQSILQWDPNHALAADFLEEAAGFERLR
ncbi:MAG TPA: DUF5107 domain-containing protein [Bryobacteraceae bacterium]|nr:DUF5107 domain-containing protein [Bryobacteraceae bacterium]